MLARLKAEGLRVHLDDRNETLNYRIREGEVAKIPYMAVVGQREADSDSSGPPGPRGGEEAGSDAAWRTFLGRILGEVQSRAIVP